MKLQLMSLVIATALLFSCGPTTYNSTSANPAFDVPANIQTSFTTQYPAATNVTWNRYDVATVPIDWELAGWTVLDADDYAVAYNLDGENYYSWYDAEGNWIGSSSAVTDYTKLPSSISTMIKDKYSGYTIEKVDREMWKDQTAYEVKLKNGDSKIKLLVDNNGNVLKEKTK